MTMKDYALCPFRKSYPHVLVMRSGQDENGDNGIGPLDRPSQGRVFAQSACAPDCSTLHNHEHADAPHPIALLRARRERPHDRRAAAQRDELAGASIGRIAFDCRISNWHVSAP
jgi:hypothetical protein